MFMIILNSDNKCNSNTEMSTSLIVAGDSVIYQGEIRESYCFGVLKL
jgi:hypothetical protein